LENEKNDTKHPIPPNKVHYEPQYVPTENKVKRNGGIPANIDDDMKIMEDSYMPAFCKPEQGEESVDPPQIRSEEEFVESNPSPSNSRRVEIMENEIDQVVYLGLHTDIGDMRLFEINTNKINEKDFTEKLKHEIAKGNGVKSECVKINKVDTNIFIVIIIANIDSKDIVINYKATEKKLKNYIITYRNKYENLVKEWNTKLKEFTSIQITNTLKLSNPNNYKAILKFIKRIHKAELEISKIYKQFTLFARSYIRQIHNQELEPFDFHKLFGIPFPFYCFGNFILVSSKDLPTKGNEFLENLNKAMNAVRWKTVAGNVDIMVPISKYLEYYGVGYLAIGIEDISFDSLEYAHFGDGAFSKTEQIVKSIESATTKLLSSGLETVINSREDYVIYNGILLVVKPGITISHELLMNRNIAVKCSECKENICDDHYQHKDYICCADCFRELNDRKLLKWRNVKSSSTLKISSFKSKDIPRKYKEKAEERLIERLNCRAKQLHSPSEVWPLLKSYGLDADSINIIYESATNTHFRIILLSALIGKVVKKLVDNRLEEEKECKKALRLPIITSIVKSMEDTNYSEALSTLKEEYSIDYKEQDIELLLKTKLPLFSTLNTLRLHTTVPYNTESILDNLSEDTNTPILSLAVTQLIRKLPLINKDPVEIVEIIKKMSKEAYEDTTLVYADTMSSLAFYLYSKQNLIPSKKLVEIHTLAVNSYINVKLFYIVGT